MFRRCLLGAVLLGAGLCFALGYRLPWRDRHPDWPAFPRTTNPRLVVEKIPDFAARYGRRFPAVLARPWARQDDFADVYRLNLRHVRALGYQVTENHFEPRFSLGLHWTSPNDPGRSEGLPTRVGFYTEGYVYVQLRLGEETACFKLPSFGPEGEMVRFYQYNVPRSCGDTLYLRYWDSDYRVVCR
ncbi:hypothetical protein JAO73_02390 [Hymenobacter sp. BT523]|uniref:hypothetical protein n=1 Tax=Hymenobacter sp. BT523 TaxID=2795725 RepID=UPI0018EC511D|nr:hypothetical protein [Hymenobacter sp. BT523]MBJ6107843.1 hypothetical protein [Hymenobacter sp. BT523]